MPRSVTARRVISALRWGDRWVSAAGRSCCVGRSQAEMQKSIEKQKPTRDRRASVARAFGERS